MVSVGSRSKYFRPYDGDDLTLSGTANMDPFSGSFPPSSSSQPQRQASPPRSQQKAFLPQRVSPPPHTPEGSSRQQRRANPPPPPSQPSSRPTSETIPHPRFCSCRGCAPDLYEESGRPMMRKGLGSYFLKFSCVAGCRCSFCRMANDPAKEVQGGDCLHDGHRLAARYRCQSARCPCHVGCSNRQQCRVCSRIR